MNALAPITAQIKPAEPLYRKAAKECDANVLPQIYNQDTNIVIWQRDLEQTLSLIHI